MAYPENRERNINFNEQRYDAFYQLWAEYESKLKIRTESEYGVSLLTAERLFAIFLRRGFAPHSTHLLDNNGHVKPETALGFAMMVSKEVALARLSAIGKALREDEKIATEIPITCDMPSLTTSVRNMFPPEADGEVIRICQTGIIDGWNATLEILGRNDIPLEIFPKNLEQHLRRRTEIFFPSENGIVLPTALSGVKARYDYTNEFTLPFVSLAIDHPQAA